MPKIVMMLVLMCVSMLTGGCTLANIGGEIDGGSDAGVEGVSPPAPTEKPSRRVTITNGDSDNSAPAEVEASQPVGCNYNSECGSNAVCQDGTCSVAPVAPPSTPAPVENAEEDMNPPDPPADPAPSDPPPTTNPPPPAPVINLSVTNSWTIAELANLPEGTPAFVRTVIHGFDPVDLPAEFMGLTCSPLTGDCNDPYLTMQTGNDSRWAEWGGPAHGMSGSPIIINGRNAGALSFASGGLRLQPPYPFWATPLEKMLRVNPNEGLPNQSGAQPMTALFVTNDSRFNDRVTSWGNNENLVLMPQAIAISGQRAAPNRQLAPGDGLAVLIVGGDVIKAGAIGTVTAVDGDKLYAFGHPFFRTGKTGMPFTAAHVEGIDTSVFIGAFKVAQPAGETQGVITSDRGAAVAGYFNRSVPMTDIRTTITNHGETFVYNHRSARLSLLTVPLGVVIAYVNALTTDAVRDMMGDGSAEYTISYSFEETQRVATQSGMLSSPYDLVGDLWMTSFSSSAEFVYGAIPGTISDAELTVTIEDERRDVMIERVDAPTSAHPGDQIAVEVALRDQDRVASTQSYTLTVPADFTIGYAQLAVSSEQPPPQPMDDQGKIVPPTTLDEVIAQFNAAPRTNVLEVRLTGAYPPPLPCPLCDQITGTCPPCPPPPIVVPMFVNMKAEQRSVVLGNLGMSVDIQPTEPPPPPCDPTTPAPDCTTPTPPPGP